MKKLAAALITLAIALPPTVIAQEEPNLVSLLRDFASIIDDPEITMTVIHLNNATVEAYFVAPTKYSLRVQAKQTTIFYVQGRVKRSMQVEERWEVRQGARIIRCTTVNISNFEPGRMLSDGDRFTGLVVLEQLVNPRAEFTMVNGDQYRFDFTFSPNAVAQINSP